MLKIQRLYGILSYSSVARLTWMVGCLYLIGAWVAVVLVDIFNTPDLQQTLIELSWISPPLLLFHLFSEGNATEQVQRIYLLISIILVIAMWRHNFKHPQKELSWVLPLLLIGFTFMYLEEHLNLRHVIAHVWLSDYNLNHPYRILLNIGYYSALGGLMTFSMALLWYRWRPQPPAVRFLLAGYVFYATAALGSATSHWGGWYQTVGDAIIFGLGLQHIPVWKHALDNPLDFMPHHTYEIGFLVMDCLFEESIELLGAIFLATGLILLHREITRRKTTTEASAS